MEEPSGDEQEESDEDAGEKLQALVAHQQACAQEPQIFWRHFCWEFVEDGYNVQAVLNEAGASAESLFRESGAAICYIGITRDPMARYRGVPGRPDIKPHCRRFTAMYVLAAGPGEVMGRLERALIRHIRRLEQDGAADVGAEALNMVLANIGKGGESARRRIKTFLYVCTVGASDAV